jgi:hypothetical protein
MELQELYEKINDQIGPEDSGATPTSQDLTHGQLQELCDEIHHENVTPNEQCFFQDASSQTTSQELRRQMSSQIEPQELHEEHCFYEDIELDEGHVLASPELHRQLELQELYEQIYDQIEPICDD